MEIHPPEHGIHSFRDFLVHMGTIILGLLIAIGLEQSVETFHRRHERIDLRASLREEAEQVITDADHTESKLRQRLDIMSRRRSFVYAALWTGQHKDGDKIVSIPEDLEYPFDPIFRSALATSRVSLLSPEETTAYMELMYDMEQTKSSYSDYANAVHERMRFETELPRTEKEDEIDIARVDRELLQRYLDLVAAEIETGQRLRIDCAQTAGAEKVLLHGELQLSKLYEGEAKGMREVMPFASY